MKKDYQKWHKLKKQIEHKQSSQLFREMEVWWCSLGENVGFEEDGKNKFFERPVLIFRKFNRNLFWGLPLTGQKKENKFHFNFILNDREQGAMLSQLRPLSPKRLIRKMDKVSDEIFHALEAALIRFIQKAETPLRGFPRVPNGNYSAESDDQVPRVPNGNLYDQYSNEGLGVNILADAVVDNDFCDTLDASMSYAIYKTEAIVLRSIPDREANADVVFLTRDLGKITVRAQAARKLESKHRMQLGRYNHVIIDVVRGAHIWRLTGIHQVAQYQVFADNKILHAFHRAAILAEHLIRGEDAHPELFDFFVSLLEYSDAVIPDKPMASRRDPGSSVTLSEIQSSQSLDPGLRRDDTNGAGLELFAVIHVLDMLGYWPGEKLPLQPSADVFQKCLDKKTELVAQINEGIRATQIT